MVETDLNGTVVFVVGKTEWTERPTHAIQAIHIALAPVRICVVLALDEETRLQERSQPWRPHVVILHRNNKQRRKNHNHTHHCMQPMNQKEKKTEQAPSPWPCSSAWPQRWAPGRSPACCSSQKQAKSSNGYPTKSLLLPSLQHNSDWHKRTSERKKEKTEQEQRKGWVFPRGSKGRWWCELEVELERLFV